MLIVTVKEPKIGITKKNVTYDPTINAEQLRLAVQVLIVLLSYTTPSTPPVFTLATGISAPIQI